MVSGVIKLAILVVAIGFASWLDANGWIWFIVVVVGLQLFFTGLEDIFRHRERGYLAAGGNRRTNRRVRRGEGHGIDELARRLDLGVSELRAFLPSYRRVTIPKRRGGVRELDVPDAKTKDIQRRILRRLLAKLRVHEAACGFEKGRSIVHNARPHVGQRVIIKLDIVDFFPTTSAERVQRYFQWVGWDLESAKILTALTTHNGGLPQGAPTSPRLSNLVNFYTDVQLANLARRRKGRYTRYADDITFSFPKDYPRCVRGVVQSATRILKVKGYTVHRGKKLDIRRRHDQQRVTGLVVNDRVNLPRATRRRLRAIEHRLTTTGSATMNESQLAGWRALMRMIESQRDGGE